MWKGSIPTSEWKFNPNPQTIDRKDHQPDERIESQSKEWSIPEHLKERLGRNVDVGPVPFAVFPDFDPRPQGKFSTRSDFEKANLSDTSETNRNQRWSEGSANFHQQNEYSRNASDTSATNHSQRSSELDEHIRLQNEGVGLSVTSVSDHSPWSSEENTNVRPHGDECSWNSSDSSATTRSQCSWEVNADEWWRCDKPDMEKPQSKFHPKVDNSTALFKPSLRWKPNALEPLNIYLEVDKDGKEFFCHPYWHELNAFKVPSRQLQMDEPIPPSNTNSFDGIILVDDEESLDFMMSDLETVEEMAVDTEYHSFRSFYGFLCVLQISTRARDYVIDAIALRSELEVLNKYFTDPNILKVMHAAHSDVQWLQKDLNLYVVNMFDTSAAATELNSRLCGLASLLNQHCGVIIEKNKEFQKHFDWRIRPLPRNAIMYARDDSHYLLYLHDMLRNELIARSNSIYPLNKVYNQCTEICKKTFRKPPSGLPALLRKFSNDYRRSYVTKLLYEWRDKLCREMDESTGYVLPNRVFSELVDRLPETVEEIENVFWPIPPIVQTRLDDLLSLIAEARKQPITGDLSQLSNMKEVETRSQATQTENEGQKKTVIKTCTRSTQTPIEKEDVPKMCSQSSQTEDTNMVEGRNVNVAVNDDPANWW